LFLFGNEAQRRAAVGLVDALPVDEKTLVMVDSIKRFTRI
jgi:ATP-dependent DNA helicase RecQ